MGIKATLIRAFNVSKLFAKEKSPEILIGTGIVCGVAAVVSGCMATPKCLDILSEYDDNMSMVEEAEAKAQAQEIEYDANNDRRIFTARCAWKLFRCYAVTAGLTAAMIGCTLGGFHIIKVRYENVAMAFSSLAAFTAAYRKRVIETEGEARDRYYATGIKEEVKTIEKVDENGNKTTETVVERSGKIDEKTYNQLFTFEWSPKTSDAASNDATQNQIMCVNKEGLINNIIHREEFIDFNYIQYKIFLLKQEKAPRTAYGAVFGAKRNKIEDGNVTRRVRIQTSIIPNRDDGAILVEVLGMEPLFNPLKDLDVSIKADDDYYILYDEDKKPVVDDPYAYREWIHQTNKEA